MIRRVAFQGEPGAFSEEAVQALFGARVETVPLHDFQAVGEAVVAGDVDAGLLPVENTIAGSVAPAYDVLAALPLRVVAEVTRPIRQCLLGVPGARVEDLRRALSHPVALAQCTTFLRSHPKIEAIAVSDTAGAARSIATAEDPAAAAIASRLAAERYGLEILVRDIQDRSDNQTRFFAVVAATDHATRADSADDRAPGPHKTAIVLETANRPGALVEVLLPFARREINLTRLESRPAPEPWTYRFILELESDDPERETAAVDEARQVAAALRVLGTFPLSRSFDEGET